METIDCIPVKPEDGKFILREKAAEDLARYIAVNNIDITDENAVLGHVLAIEWIRKLLFNIDSLNSSIADPKQVLMGLRIYNAIEEREDGTLKECVFLMPVTAKGEDLHKVMPIDAIPNTIVGGSRPCPNQCSFIFQESNKVMKAG